MNPMNAMLTGGLAGLLRAVGVLCAISVFHRRRSTLVARLEPYVHRRPMTSGLLAAPVGPTSDGNTAVGLPMASTARALSLGRLIDTLGPSADLVRRRLTRSGPSLGADQFRLQQVLRSTTALLLVLTAGSLAALARSVSVPALIPLCLMGTVAGAAARDWWLSQAVAKRLSRIEVQLPDAVELLAPAVEAGRGPVPAIERIVALDRGGLVDELGSTLTDIRPGMVLPTALDRMERRIGFVYVTHLCEAVIVTLERDTSLAEVLRSQVTDVCEAARQDPMEEGGRREIIQMVPVIFLVLPITVVFVLFPGLFAPRLGVRSTPTTSSPLHLPSLISLCPLAQNPDRQQGVVMKHLFPPTSHRLGLDSRSWRAAGATRIDLRDERGGVLDRVLVTLMTVGLVVVLWMVAGSMPTEAFLDAIAKAISAI